MNAIDARTILSLNDQRNRAEAGQREALLAQAEMEHELRALRHMKREITDCLLDRRTSKPGNCHHTIGKIARIIRNAQPASRHDGCR